MSRRYPGLFDANLYRFETPQPSYWEATATSGGPDASALENGAACDVAVIGGGYTGLSAALHLARDYSVDVRVIDAGHIGWGASGRNAGFCCPGGTRFGARTLIRRVGEDRARRYYAAQQDAVELVRDLAASEQIDLQPQGSAEVEVAHSAAAFGRLARDAEVLRSVLGLNAQLLPRDVFRNVYFDSPAQFGALAVRPAFGLQPLNFCRGLAGAARRRGVTLHEHSEIIEWNRDDTGRHRLTSRHGSLAAGHVVFATNGFMPENLHNGFSGRTLPMISAIVVTRPLTRDELDAHSWTAADVFTNSRRVLNYFRLLPDNRLLFGGRGDVNGSVAGEAGNYARLTRQLGDVWPAWRGIGIDYRWHGLICMTATGCPSIGRLDADGSVYFAFGYHGNGVNNAVWAGRELAAWIGTGRRPQRLPDIASGLSRRFPLPGLRRIYLRLALASARLADRFA